MSNKRLSSVIHENTCNSIIERKMTQLKIGKRLKDISLEKMFKWQNSTRKHAQHHK